ncbi:MULTISPECIES: DUF302 domain-containing protein [unclassified Mesorhizobium]|uniref:DUF302 domain-containing protein n=1 Tax=unclassified Mesorhizobium TaxID=325217 RepID=UPI000FCA8B56|nr:MULTISPECIES: DUF302 domain-containing protein [unclassified Mesorhizobium]MBZ9717901.1 DUF302 domain-containing protein [Mesorhizobium sp. AD1-1]RUY86976.1 DUF302 domain-containing protein [Mesorhizobium sp. M7A.F.Ca.CA.001.12.2.1]RUZ14686.1 DUF302 domain-containing protein [Mesorhizobium sp. M7A.F.Ca.US.007.01.2.1]RUZ34056.1 DUF302 domain-containing protein [Mesorhizobium sp. M7A.F.Ca.US.003.02.1.1]RUZ55738.1 DUF302 domain-containing protein [Mesorhizobium sp. M7A.F.Ca.US.007.01.1.1]
MGYYFSKIIAMPFTAAIDLVTDKLASKGFGVLTSIDVQQTMQAKLGADFRPYVILGACNPHFAWRALQAEDKIGTMLPCNVIVTEVGPGKVEVAAVDPVASMGAIGNRELAQVANDVRRLLEEMVREL